MKRKDFIVEIKTRKYLHEAVIKHYGDLRKETYNKFLMDEYIKKVIRKVLHEAKIADKIPHSNTGINVLQDLLKKIIKILEMGYKTLTTSSEQRKSFRSHILSAIMNSIAPPRTLSRADVESLTGYKSDDLNSLEFDDSPEGDIGNGGSAPSLDITTSDPEALQERVVNKILKIINEDIDINIDDDENMSDPLKARQGEDGIIDVDESPQVDLEEEDPKNEFGLDSYTGDMTGRNIAYETFQKIENNVIDSYNLLSNDEDRQMFYTYLIVNIMLYFDRFEEELQETLATPSVDAYEDAKQEEPGISKSGGQDNIGEELDDLGLGGEEDLGLDNLGV